MKLCSKCKTKKKDSEFNKQNKNTGRLRTHCKCCVNDYNKEYQSTKEGYLNISLGGAKSRAKNKQVAFELDIEYLHSIATDKCPVFNVDLKYASSQKGQGNTDPHTAALDRVIPELGYIKGNVVFISQWANSIKSDATEVQLYAVADWLHAKRKEVLNAFKEQLAPVSEGDYIQGAVGAELGSVSTPWTWEDYDRTDDYSGATRGENAYHSAKEGSGDGVGCGSEEVGPPQTPQSEQDNGISYGKIVSYEELCRHLFGKP